MALLLLAVAVPVGAHGASVSTLQPALFQAWVAFAGLLAWGALTQYDGGRLRHVVVYASAAGVFALSVAATALPTLTAVSAALVLLAWVAMVGEYLTHERIRPPTLRDYYDAAVRSRRVRPDARQLDVVDALDAMAAAYLRYEARRHLPWAGLLRTPRGVYLHGPAGRGKSYLIDGMYDVCGARVKRRYHYHELMSGLNAAINAADGRGVSVRDAARRLAPRASLVVIDEVNVLDVASVVLFTQLVEAWWRRGCVVCMSSNQAPEALFDTLLADTHIDVGTDFVRAVNHRTRVLALQEGEDYRLQKLSAADLYQAPVTADTEHNLRRVFELLAESAIVTTPVHVGSRELRVVMRATAIAWFDFAALCGAPASYEDYLLLVREHPTLIVSNLPQITDADAARRFAWLVEIVYDAKQRLVLSAAVPCEALFAPEILASRQDADFIKILSRLAEMASSEYSYSLALE